jgi:hypothetical protein
LKAGGVAILDPEAWFAAMAVKTALRWSRHYELEPWGNKESGVRTGLLALSAGNIEKDAVDDFVVSAPTKRESVNIAKWRQEADEFDRWKRRKG